MYANKPASINQEALAYSFSAILSMLDLAVIQHQHAAIYDIIVKNMIV